MSNELAWSLVWVGVTLCAVIAWVFVDSGYFSFRDWVRDVGRKVGKFLRGVWADIDCIPTYPFGGHIRIGGKVFAVREGQVSLTGGWGMYDVLPVRTAQMLASEWPVEELWRCLPRRDPDSESPPGYIPVLPAESLPVPPSLNAGMPGITYTGDTVQFGLQRGSDGVIRRVTIVDGVTEVNEVVTERGEPEQSPPPLNVPAEEPLPECARCHRRAVLRVRVFGNGIRYIMCDECYAGVLAGLAAIAAKPASTEYAPAKVSDVLGELEAELEVPEEDQPGWAASTG